MVKLNLGSNDKTLEGWANVDIIDGPGVDIVASAHDLHVIEDESVDEILAEHLLEHLTFRDANAALSEWYRVLKTGGYIEIEVPDLEGLCSEFCKANNYRRYWTTGSYWAIIHQIYGNQRGRGNKEVLSQVHKSGYTREHLTFMLDGTGFKDIYEIPYLKGPLGASVFRLKAKK